MHLVTGYKTLKKDAEPTVLYCGRNRGEAIGILEDKPKDSSIIRLEYVSFDRAIRRKVYEQVAEVKVQKSTPKKPKAK